MDLHFPKKLASHEKLTGNDIRVFLAFLPELDFQNKPVPVNQKKLAEEIGMKKTTLNRSLRRLIDTGFLVKSGVPGHPLFAFPPTAVWRGEGKGHVIAINEWRRTKAAEAAARRATTTEVD
ncbi:hypothetical protein AGMMS49545_02100 [Betaproteobacteria bacterium]|nr:hypothetical protein AGMMS49545_02100 [Betaproteobacteria bacterium]GHU43850.1 hypothetical protein AGMMS50289_11010 [Betaproteobacteria bacterium]